MMAFGGFYRYPIRWFYLPAGIFFIFAGILLYRFYIFLKKKIKSNTIIKAFIILLVLVLTVSDIVKTQVRGMDWIISSDITKSITKDLRMISSEIDHHKKIAVFNLPDNYRGAYVLRNGFRSMIEILFPFRNVCVKEINKTSKEFFRSADILKYKGYLMLEYRDGHLFVIK